MQILYLSNRPDVLAETIDYVTEHMPWIDDFVVIAPPAMRFDGMGVRAIDEMSLLTQAERAALSPLGHGPRNTMLRRAVIERGDLQDTFIMSDDDYRPIRDVAESDMVDAGRLHGYVSHDLAAWRQVDTSYDHTQRYAYTAMLMWGCPHLGYGAHMPQAIHRGVFTEANRAWDHLTEGIDRYGADRYGIDEWSLANNWGRKHYPELFWSPRRYRTLGWPQFPHQWPRHIRPTQIQFENFYPEMYGPGQLFDGIPTASSPGENESRAFVKIERWLELDHRLDRLSTPADRSSPWTSTALRRTALTALRPAAKVAEYLSFGQRERTDAMTAQLTGWAQHLDADEPCE